MPGSATAGVAAGVRVGDGDGVGDAVGVESELSGTSTTMIWLSAHPGEDSAGAGEAVAARAHTTINASDISHHLSADHCAGRTCPA